MRSDLYEELERLLTAGLRDDAREAGLHEATARVLLVLDPAGPLAMGEVARRMDRDPSTATRFVDRAAGDGLVERRSGRDRRRRLVSLSPAGRDARTRLLARRRARAEAVPAAVLARTGLGGGEVEWFLETLVRALSVPSQSKVGQ